MNIKIKKNKFTAFFLFFLSFGFSTSFSIVNNYKHEANVENVEKTLLNNLNKNNNNRSVSNNIGNLNDSQKIYLFLKNNHYLDKNNYII